MLGLIEPSTEKNDLEVVHQTFRELSMMLDIDS